MDAYSYLVLYKNKNLDKGNLADWRYDNNVLYGQTLLYNYTGVTYPDPLYVPKAKGSAIINDWYNRSSSGTTDANRNTPFYNNQNIVNVDLQRVPFRNNSMHNAFSNCHNLITVSNIPNSVTNMAYTFDDCYNLNQNIQIPNSVINMTGTFEACTSLNQNIQIPNSVTSMTNTFQYCSSLNQNIQIPNSVTSMINTFADCYRLNQNIQIPNSVINTANTFYYCSNLNQNIQIPNSVTSMASTFYYCSNLNQNIQIPNSVINMYRTFSACSRLNQNILIPSSVIDLSNTFYSCSSLNQNIQIPNSVANMYDTFASCTNLNQNIQIPNSVTSMHGTFYYCTNLNQNIQIPNSVTDMAYTFDDCYNLNQNIQIPSSVTNMNWAFGLCNKLSCFINILSTEVSDATNIFYRNNSAASIPNVVIQGRYINNALTTTYNSIKAAGWTIAAAGTGTTVGPANSKIVGWDFIGGDWTYRGDGANWLLTDWTGKLSTARNDGITVTDINIPRVVHNYPTIVNYGALYANRLITSVDFNGAQFNTNAANCFLNCNALTTVKNLPVATSYYDAFGTSPAGVISSISDDATVYANEVHITLDNNTADLRYAFSNCKYIKNFYINGGWNANNVNTLNMFRYCNLSNLNIYLDCPGLHVYGSTFTGNNTSFRKDIYIYFKYQNGANTYTHTTFLANAVFKGTFSNSEIMYNSTSNFYVHNRGICPYV